MKGCDHILNVSKNINQGICMLNRKVIEDYSSKALIFSLFHPLLPIMKIFPKIDLLAKCSTI